MTAPRPTVQTADEATGNKRLSCPSLFQEEFLRPCCYERRMRTTECVSALSGHLLFIPEAHDVFKITCLFSSDMQRVC